MKKFTAILLCVCLLIAPCLFTASANAEVTGKLTDYPVIIVPGYSSSALYYGDSIETGEHVWGINMDLIMERVLKNIAKIGVGLGKMTVGDAEYIAKVVGEEFITMFDKMRCNPDGSSVYELKRYYSTAEETNDITLMNLYPSGSYRHEKDISAEIAEYIGHGKIYNFNCDFRMGSEFCATQLDEYIQSVKEYSGKDKVNIFAVSHGGQVTATYLNLFGFKNDVDNAVMTIPAIGGAALAYDLASCNAALDEECLLRFIEHGMRWEEDYDWLVKAQQLGFLDKVINALIPYVFEIMGFWGSIWDFIPADKYEEVKAQLLDPVESAELIAKCDRFHYEILPKMGEKFAECRANGMNISIIAGTGNNSVTGMQVNSDGIIPTYCSTGATCAPIGWRFADGYTQLNDCGGKYKVSPDMTVDASTAYMPDNTWFVDGLFHGMTYWDNYTRVLLMKLLLTDDLTDVYSDPAYPQFRYTSNPSSTVYFEFENGAPGYIDGNSGMLRVTNVCKESKVRLTAVNCDGLNLKFKVDPAKSLAPGESILIPYVGEIPEVSLHTVRITVYYAMGNATPLNYRTEAFTVMNGEAVEKVGDYRRSTEVTPFDTLIGDGFAAFLQKLGLKEFFTMIYTVMCYWFRTLTGFITK